MFHVRSDADCIAMQVDNDNCAYLVFFALKSSVTCLICMKPNIKPRFFCCCAAGLHGGPKSEATACRRAWGNYNIIKKFIQLEL